MDETPKGWRERKRIETKQRIWEAALGLFRERGYDGTTLDAIAEAAAISKRAFFHYFASKEEVLAAWQADVPRLFRAAVAAEPHGKTPLQVVRNVLSMMPTHFDPQQALMINRIIRSNEHLRAGNLAKLLLLEEAVFEALCERWPANDRKSEMRMVAMASIGALRVGIDRFVEEAGRTPIVDLVQEAFESLAAAQRDG